MPWARFTASAARHARVIPRITDSPAGMFAGDLNMFSRSDVTDMSCFLPGLTWRRGGTTTVCAVEPPPRVMFEGSVPRGDHEGFDRCVSPSLPRRSPARAAGRRAPGRAEWWGGPARARRGGARAAAVAAVRSGRPDRGRGARIAAPGGRTATARSPAAGPTARRIRPRAGPSEAAARDDDAARGPSRREGVAPVTSRAARRSPRGGGIRPPRPRPDRPACSSRTSCAPSGR